jgi:inositol phosphorylceramide mannosyltransferase catalytic subunit
MPAGACKGRTGRHRAASGDPCSSEFRDMIPKRLSQTWKSRALPSDAARLVQDWRGRHPDWDIRFFDDADCREVVRSVAPERLDLYDRLPFGVMRADVFRYAVVLRDGGVYADIDMECLRPIDDLLEVDACLLAVEARLGRTRTRELGYAAPFQIANCIFAAEPGHPFVRAALDRAFARVAAVPVPSRDEVEDLTGPRMLTRLFFERTWPGVSLAHPITLMAPLFYPTDAPFGRNIRTRHRTFGTWKAASPAPSLTRRWIERNRLVCPFPSRLTRRAGDGATSPWETP